MDLVTRGLKRRMVFESADSNLLIGHIGQGLEGFALPTREVYDD